MLEEEDEDQITEKAEKISSLKRNYDRLYWLWIVIIIFDLVVQSLRSADMSSSREKFISKYYQWDLYFRPIDLVSRRNGNSSHAGVVVRDYPADFVRLEAFSKESP